jgi:hypothetical protein
MIVYDLRNEWLTFHLGGLGQRATDLGIVKGSESERNIFRRKGLPV